MKNDLFFKLYNVLFDFNRDIAGTLANENETMRDHMRQTEQDTIDVVTFLKKQDVDKDTDVNRITIFTNKSYSIMII